MKKSSTKAFGLWSAVFLGIGSMVGAGIFIVIGEAGAIAGNLVWVSFVIGGIAALLSGYSLARLASAYPSRGGIVEYLVQGFGEGVFSGSAGVLFYFSQLIAIAAVAKSFGTYADTLMHGNGMTNWYALGIVGFFVVINLLGASLVAKSENMIVFIKVTVLVFFTGIALFYVDPKLLGQADMLPISNVFFAVGLTFFAYQGFSVITNTVEDMENPKQTMLKAMVITIVLVGFLYVLTSLAVLGNLPLSEVISAKDYALAQAASPLFGSMGFKVMAVTALLATASAINATLYAATEIGYTLAKEGNLPHVYTYNIYHSFEGLVISALLETIEKGIAFLIGFYLIYNAIVVTMIFVASMFGIAGITLYHTSRQMPMLGFYILGAFGLAFGVEVLLRLLTKRIISKQSGRNIFKRISDTI